MLRLLIAALVGFVAAAVAGVAVAWLFVTIVGGHSMVVFVALGAAFGAGAFAAVRVLRWYDRREQESERRRAAPPAAGPIAGLDGWRADVSVETSEAAAPSASEEAAPSPPETATPAETTESSEPVDDGDDEARFRRSVRAELLK